MNLGEWNSEKNIRRLQDAGRSSRRINPFTCSTSNTTSISEDASRNLPNNVKLKELEDENNSNEGSISQEVLYATVNTEDPISPDRAIIVCAWFPALVAALCGLGMFCRIFGCGLWNNIMAIVLASLVTILPSVLARIITVMEINDDLGPWCEGIIMYKLWGLSCFACSLALGFCYSTEIKKNEKCMPTKCICGWSTVLHAISNMHKGWAKFCDAMTNQPLTC